MAPNFSICIPTYNRAECIGTLLASLLPQVTDNVEIVVVDGCSADTTESVVAEFQRSCPAIRYFRRERNVGVDADILKMVELAQGAYCWLLSDDDRVLPGALAHVRSRLAEHPQLAGASLNYVAFDKDLKFRVREVPAAGGGQLHADHFFHSGEEAFAVLGIHFGYLSAQVVNRALWLEVVGSVDLKPYFNAWLMVYIIGQMLRRQPSRLYLHQRCVAYRSGNDSFTARLGTYKRQLITHLAYAEVVGALFGRGSKTYRAVFNILIGDRMARTLMVLKAGGASFRLQCQLFALYMRQYWSYPRYWFRVMPMFFVPSFFARLVRRVYFWRRSRLGNHGVEGASHTSGNVQA